MYKNEVFVRFVIKSDTLTPEEITKVLNTVPTTFWTKGTPKSNQHKLTHKYNKWEIFIKSQNVYHTDTLLKELFCKLYPIKTNILLLKNVTKEISIVIYKREVMPSITYDTSIIEFLHYLDVTLDIDVIEVGK